MCSRTSLGRLQNWQKFPYVYRTSLVNKFYRMSLVQLKFVSLWAYNASKSLGPFQNWFLIII